jgi:spore germination cell wall hydrolase CwlJ-like protein
MISAICLAMVIYTEARGEPIEGRLAVAEVVINRMERGGTPKSLCAVTFQANQFAAPAKTLKSDEWQESLLIAKAVLKDPEGTLPGLGATFFHSVDVLPYWAPHMKRVARIGRHIFYGENA